MFGQGDVIYCVFYHGMFSQGSVIHCVFYYDKFNHRGCGISSAPRFVPPRGCYLARSAEIIRTHLEFYRTLSFVKYSGAQSRRHLMRGSSMVVCGAFAFETGRIMADEGDG